MLIQLTSHTGELPQDTLKAFYFKECLCKYSINICRTSTMCQVPGLVVPIGDSKINKAFKTLQFSKKDLTNIQRTATS